MVDLKPCPFCGETLGPSLNQHDFPNLFFHPGTVTDKGCVLSGKGFYSYEIEAWNERATPLGLDGRDDEDMANVGRALMDAIEKDFADHPFMKAWHPADCPTEIVGDLLNALDEATPPAAEGQDDVERVARGHQMVAVFNMSVENGLLEIDPRQDSNHPLHDIVCGWCGKIHSSPSEQNAEMEKIAARFEHCADMIARGFNISGTLRAEHETKARHYALEARAAIAAPKAPDAEPVAWTDTKQVAYSKAGYGGGTMLLDRGGECIGYVVVMNKSENIDPKLLDAQVFSRLCAHPDTAPDEGGSEA